MRGRRRGHCADDSFEKPESPDDVCSLTSDLCPLTLERR